MASKKISDPARTQLRDSLVAIEEGRRGAAVDSARELAAGGERTTRFVGARLLYLLRSYQEALDTLRDHLSSRPDDGYAHRLQFSMLKRLRFEQEAGPALDALLKVADDATVRQAAVLHYQGMGRPDLALRHLERVLERSANDPGTYRLQLNVAVEAGDAVAARRGARRALDLAPASWLEIVDRSIEIGLFDLAEREAVKRESLPEGRALLAQLAVYRGDWSNAIAHATAALELDHDNERAVTALVAATVATGDLVRAELELSRFSGEAGPALRTWHAEILRRKGDFEQARDVLARVQNDFSNYLAAKLVWVLVKGELDDEEWATTSAYDGLLEGQLQALGLELTIENEGMREADLRLAAAEALDRMAGNRSPFPSIVVGGELRAVRIPSSPRNRGRDVQHRACWVGIDQIKQEIVAELDRIGPHPIAECYDAELYLWSGDYEVAREKFEDILRRLRRTVWGWIGLGASQTLLGDPERGLATLDEGVREMGWRGATVPIYRGEALYRLGRLDEAAAELREAADNQPSRFAAWVLRVLVEEERGNPDARDRCFDHLEHNASALLSDAARSCAIEGWWPAAPSAEVKVRVAQECLHLMRGNRSSSCSFWFAPDTEIVRSVVYGRPVTSPKWEAYEQRSLRELT